MKNNGNKIILNLLIVLIRLINQMVFYRIWRFRLGRRKRRREIIHQLGMDWVGIWNGFIWGFMKIILDLRRNCRMLSLWSELLLNGKLILNSSKIMRKGYKKIIPMILNNIFVKLCHHWVRIKLVNHRFLLNLVVSVLKLILQIMVNIHH